MIKHIVMFKFKEEADGRSRSENVAMTKAMLDALPAQIPQITSSFTELGCAHADMGNYDLLLTATFQTMEDLASYIVHPAHQAVGAFMKPLRESRACIDIEV